MKKSKRTFIDNEFHKVAKQICDDTKTIKKIKRYEISDLTASLVPVLKELQIRLNHENKKNRYRKKR